MAVVDGMEKAKRDVVAANRVLAREGILDAYGHVSVRSPDDPGRFLLAKARSPENVEVDDILDFDVEEASCSEDVQDPLYIERFIHAAVYGARPDVHVVCHNHALSILPFSISTSTKLRATINASKPFGDGVAVWDIADGFGHDTDLLVRDMEQGRSLAACLGDRSMVLMRGHGSVVVARDVLGVVNACLAMDRGAKAQLAVMTLGGVRPFTAVELEPHAGLPGGLPTDDRAWEYFASRAQLGE